MAEDPAKTQASRANNAENGMLLRRILLKYGYDSLPDNDVSKFMMRFGALGDIAMMPVMDFFARTLTPRGTNIPPAGAVMIKQPDGTEKAVPLIELYDRAMRDAKIKSAQGMAGEVLTMGAASLAGVAMTGPVGLIVTGGGQLLGRNFGKEIKKIPIIGNLFTAIEAAATPRGTHLQDMTLTQLAREMVTFTRAKLQTDSGFILSGQEVMARAGAPSPSPTNETIKFDKIWQAENKLKNPEQGALHQLVKILADDVDRAGRPQDALSFERFQNDPAHPFYVPGAGEPSRAYAAALDTMLDFAGIPDMATKNTPFLNNVHSLAMTPIDKKILEQQKEIGKALPPMDYKNYDWSRMPSGQLLTLPVSYRHARDPNAPRTETFSTYADADNRVFFIGRDEKRYSAQEFQELVDARRQYLSPPVMKESLIKEAPPEDPLAREKALLGKAETFKTETSTAGRQRNVVENYVREKELKGTADLGQAADAGTRNSSYVLPQQSI